MNSASEIDPSLIAFEKRLLMERYFASASEMVFSCFEIFFESFLSPTANSLETRRARQSHQ